MELILSQEQRQSLCLDETAWGNWGRALVDAGIERLGKSASRRGNHASPGLNAFSPRPLVDLLILGLWSGRASWLWCRVVDKERCSSIGSQKAEKEERAKDKDTPATTYSVQVDLTV